MRKLKKQVHNLNELREIAERLLIGTGTLETCHEHDTLINAGKPEALVHAYCLANKRITSGRIKLLPGRTNRDFTDLIKEIHDKSPAACRYCRKLRDRDVASTKKTTSVRRS